MMSLSGERRARPPRLHAVLIGLVALALALQGYLVGAHDHTAAAFHPAIASAQPASGSAAQRERQPAHAPDTCPICQAIALAAAWLPAAAIALREPAHRPVWYPLFEIWQLPQHRRSHAWNSRGPPRMQDPAR